jgi:hypothetical protein
MSKLFIFKTTTVVASIIVALVLSEILARHFGYRPWRAHGFDAKEPTTHAPDPELGWRNKEGSFTVPPYHPSGKPIHITNLDNGRRRTGYNLTPTEGEIVVVGGSYSQGWAISDNETFAWRLQEAYPHLTVENYGTGAYGSYQSLLVLERRLPKMVSPKIVLYGFIDHHESRNVAPGMWLRMLSSFSNRGHVKMPYSTLDDNDEIVRHSPEGYLQLPFRQSLALVDLIERTTMKMKTGARSRQKRAVTEAILLEMEAVSSRYGATFYVVFLDSREDTKRHYIGFLDRYKIGYIDCVHPLDQGWTVPGESHPNGRLNAFYAQKISEAIGDRLAK